MRFTTSIVCCITLSLKYPPIKTLILELGSHEIDIQSINVYGVPTMFVKT